MWVHGPGQEPWEVYVVKADAATLGKSAQAGADGGDGCCTGTAVTAEPAAAECACGQ